MGEKRQSGRFPWRRKWQPTPVFLPGESHGQRSLVGYSPQGRKESDTTEGLHKIVIQQINWYLPSSVKYHEKKVRLFKEDREMRWVFHREVSETH